MIMHYRFVNWGWNEHDLLVQWSLCLSTNLDQYEETTQEPSTHADPYKRVGRMWKRERESISVGWVVLYEVGKRKSWGNHGQIELLRFSWLHLVFLWLFFFIQTTKEDNSIVHFDGYHLLKMFPIDHVHLSTNFRLFWDSSLRLNRIWSLFWLFPPINVVANINNL